MGLRNPIRFYIHMSVLEFGNYRLFFLTEFSFEQNVFSRQQINTFSVPLAAYYLVG